MVVQPPNDTISVTITDLPDDHLAEAVFGWEIEDPTKTYTIPVGDTLSIRFGTEWVARPVGVTVLYADEYGNSFETIGNESRLRDFFGEDFAHAVEEVARTGGFCALQLALSPAERAELTTLQWRSPSTPSLLRKACGAKLKELGILPPQENDQKDQTSSGADGVDAA